MRWNISAICTPLGPLESAASRVFFSASPSQVGLGRACAHCDADARFHHVDAALRSDMALPDELRPCHDDKVMHFTSRDLLLDVLGARSRSRSWPLAIWKQIEDGFLHPL